VNARSREGRAAAGLRLAIALGGFWRVHRSNAEGRDWLETFLAQAEADAALRWAGELAGLHGDLVVAQARLTESLALARRADDKRGVAAALGAMGSAVFRDGDVAGSLAPFAEAAVLTRKLGDLRQTAFLLAHLAYAVGHQGDPTRAEALAADSEELVRSLGDANSFDADLAVMDRG
jgi:hypothetical protein